VTVATITLGEASRMLRDALKDTSYRSTPLGLEVARYIRWKRTEWGAAKDTIRDYEPALARLALFFADLELRDFETPVGAERLRECWDHHWGDRSARTRAKILSIWRDFFDWAIRENRGIHGNPARVLRSPKRRGVKREPFAGSFVDLVVAAQDYLPDQLGVRLILQYGLRRAEVAGVRFRDFDFERQQLTIVGKGGKPRQVPLPDPAFWRDLGAVELDLGGRASCLDRFLVAPRRKVGMKTTHFHHHGFKPRSVHTWWYDRLEAAGLCGDKESGTRKGLNMHRGRHTVATEILRGSGNLVAAQKLLGHADLSTTEEHYASFDTEDVATVLRSIRGHEEL
jgi:site-specific recombinase XerC